jgi:hypothetical protein
LIYELNWIQNENVTFLSRHWDAGTTEVLWQPGHPYAPAAQKRSFFPIYCDPAVP